MDLEKANSATDRDHCAKWKHARWGRPDIVCVYMLARGCECECESILGDFRGNQRFLK